MSAGLLLAGCVAMVRGPRKVLYTGMCRVCGRVTAYYEFDRDGFHSPPPPCYWGCK